MIQFLRKSENRGIKIDRVKNYQFTLISYVPFLSLSHQDSLSNELTCCSSVHPDFTCVRFNGPEIICSVNSDVVVNEPVWQCRRWHLESSHVEFCLI